jgi:Carboxypeptidase regulatory-like domain
MRKLWRTSVSFAVVAAVFAAVSLFAQATARWNDPVATASDQTAQPALSRQERSQPANPQTGIIVGTVTDMNDAPVSGASVVIQGTDSGPDASADRSVTTNESGFFEIRDVEAGRPCVVSIRAAGFAEWDSPAVTLEPGQSKILDVDNLRIEEVQTLVTVTPESSEEVASEEVKAEETQRGFGILPNFYAVYTPSPAPLTAKLGFRLALRTAIDPFTLAGVATLAGFDQAADSPQYVQGAKGYGERFGANYANAFTEITLDGAVFPSLLRQDPLCYYKGTGTTESRVVHALASIVIAKGDNGRLEPNYSLIGGDLTSAALENLYYPRANRGVGQVFQGFAVDTAVHAAVRLLDEFVFRPSRATSGGNS